MPRIPDPSSSNVIPGFVLTGEQDGGCAWMALPVGSDAPQVFTFNVNGVSIDPAGSDSDGPVIAAQAGSFTSCNASFVVSQRAAGLGVSVQAPVVMDIFRSVDGGATWSSIWSATPANRPTIAIGARQAAVTSFDSPVYNAGDQFQAVYVSGGWAPAQQTGFTGPIPYSASVSVTLR